MQMTRPWFSYILEYGSTVLSMIGAIMLTMPDGRMFYFFVASSAGFAGFSYYHKYWGMFVNQMVFVIVNAIGLFRYVTGVWN